MFRLLIFSLCGLGLITAGCQMDMGNTQAVRLTNHQNKPLVSMVPVIDGTKNDYAWSLSDEFTSLVYERLAGSSLAVDPLPKTRALIKKLKQTQNPFGGDTAWIKQTFPDRQFIVFLELVEHQEVLKQKKEMDPPQCSADLKMNMRVRVLDIRGDTPQIVLQEMLGESHFVPRQFTRVNFVQIPWGDENFNFSPLGLAHVEFSRKIASRVEEYILLATKAAPL